MNERIDHTNYEAWLLDRLEGKLTKEQEALLDAFLDGHPELDADLGDLPTFTDPDVRLHQSDKDAMKRDLPPVGMPFEPIDDFLIARLEGDLEPAQLEALRVFVIEHPEYQRAEHIHTLVKLVPEPVTYVEKQALERHLPPRGLPTRHTLDDFLVARLEGELSAEQESALDAYRIADPNAERQWQLMRHTRIPAEALVFPAKADLKKGGKIIAIGATRASWAQHLRVAATVAVLLGLGIWTYDMVQDPVPQLVKVKELVPGKSNEGIDTSAAPADMLRMQEEGGTEVPGGPVPSVPRDLGKRAEGQLADGSTPRDLLLPQGEREETNPVVESMPQELPDPLAEQRHIPPANEPSPELAEAQLPEGRTAVQVAGGTDTLATASSEGVPLGTFLAGKLRKRILDDGDPGDRPLDGDDAVAAVDKGMKAVGGEDVGLAVKRNGSGRLSGFVLRLGRDLSITAGR